MEQTALRPKPMPGQDSGGTVPAGGSAPAAARCPHTARRRGRRLLKPLSALLACLVLVLAGVGLGTVGATVAGMSRLAELQQQAARQPHRTPAPGGAATARPGAGRSSAAPPPAPARAGGTLGLAAVDDDGPGARIVGVHVPGPGHAAGLVRGDVLLAFGTTRVDTAADLARAVSRARPGDPVELVVRHDSGGYRQLTVVPGVVT
ncbi:PDZ domain-containing protein [Streptomyces sp. DH24]|uniref:PDZ domain-containing protein n=1 Tax=Streptomyces sp. DH24 TaxID=3040123 RepID=UPI0024413F28|nr:PDZ domain-containing protein [Streptomyces sp. DH24]MDG9717843.1 PDZ domain-containing protein [Streptomyces sp. DH24]